MIAAIETEALTKRFRNVRTYSDLLACPWRKPVHVAVDGITLSVRRGEVFGVLGPNGAGKTTLVRMLTTALCPTSGSAMVLGIDVVRRPQRVRELIGIVGGEERSFFLRLSARENLEFFAALQRLPVIAARNRISELIERVGLAEAGERAFATFSTGMRQKLAVARGLLADPEVLFLDEPTRALDPISARDVRQLAREYVVQGEGRTAILATNSMIEAEELCDRVALIRAGRVVACGTIDQLRAELDYRVRCELQMRSALPELVARLRLVSGVLELEADVRNGLSLLRLTLVSDGPTLTSVLKIAVEHGEVCAFTTKITSLEEIYVEHLGDGADADP